MRIFLGIALLCFCRIVESKSTNRKCYEARTCIHSGKSRCGVDGKDKYRLFLDSCDMLEYNCLFKTDYQRTPKKNCRSDDNINPRDDQIEGSQPVDNINPGDDNNDGNGEKDPQKPLAKFIEIDDDGNTHHRIVPGIPPNYNAADDGNDDNIEPNNRGDSDKENGGDDGGAGGDDGGAGGNSRGIDKNQKTRDYPNY